MTISQVFPIKNGEAFGQCDKIIRAQALGPACNVHYMLHVCDNSDRTAGTCTQWSAQVLHLPCAMLFLGKAIRERLDALFSQVSSELKQLRNAPLL